MEFADIILPFAVKGKFTYKIPETLRDKLMVGMRVAVSFGSSGICNGIVYELHNRKPDIRSIKPVKEIISKTPEVTENQLKLWKWLADYYMCCEGEVMKAALPSMNSLNSYNPKLETYVALAKKYSDSELNEIFDSFKNAHKQYDVFLNYISLSDNDRVSVKKSQLLVDLKLSQQAVEIF